MTLIDHVLKIRDSVSNFQNLYDDEVSLIVI